MTTCKWVQSGPSMRRVKAIRPESIPSNSSLASPPPTKPSTSLKCRFHDIVEWSGSRRGVGLYEQRGLINPGMRSSATWPAQRVSSPMK